MELVKNSFASAILQVLALLTGLAVATVWRDQHNRLENYSEFRSTKTALGMPVRGAEDFLESATVLAGSALNLGAMYGHQEVMLDREWTHSPNLSLRVRADVGGELELEFRPVSDPNRTLVLRLSNRAANPSAWIETDGEGKFTSKTAIPYDLVKGHWVNLSIVNLGGQLVPAVGDKKLPAHAAPAGGVRVLFRGDSDAGRIRIDNLSVSADGQSFEQNFAGEMPWLLFLFATVMASLVFFAFEIVTSPRIAAVIAGVGFLLLCAGLAVSRGLLVGGEARNPETLRPEFREQILARMKDLPMQQRPLLLWLGGAHAWGAGASDPTRSAFERLKTELSARSGLEWINGAFPGARLQDLKQVFDAAAANRHIALVVLTVGGAYTDNVKFASDLASLAEAIKAKGARLFLVPEPVDSSQEPKLRAYQAKVKELAHISGADVVDIQSIFDRNADAGFLWWNFANLSDVGARIEADALSAPLAKEISRQK
jgi:hypothetical protein